MGNLVSNEYGELRNNELSRQIILWAKDNYNEGYDTDLYNKLLKKRACCTRQPNIPIPLLTWDNKNTKWEYSSVYIPVFNSASDITENNCKFEKNQLGENSLYYSVKEIDNFVKSIGKCETLYKQFCSKVYYDNSNFYGEEKSYYGIYLDELGGLKENESKNNLQNAYIDCNCENSILRKEALILMEADPNKALTGSIDSVVATQNLDNRCGSLIDKTFKTTDNRKDMLCVNNVVAKGKVELSDAAKFNVNQKCSQEKNGLTSNDIMNAVLAALANSGKTPIPNPTTVSMSKITTKSIPNIIDNNTINKNSISTSVNILNNVIPNTKSNNIGIIIGSIIGVILLIVIIIIIMRYRSSSRSASYNLQKNQSFSSQQVPGQQVPGQQVPGQQVPGQQVPGQQVPGQQVPGQPF